MILGREQNAPTGLLALPICSLRASSVIALLLLSLRHQECEQFGLAVLFDKKSYSLVLPPSEDSSTVFFGSSCWQHTPFLVPGLPRTRQKCHDAAHG
jgi:hypothetical protein